MADIPMSYYNCPICGEFGFADHREYIHARPARRARLFGLIPARPARGSGWRLTCPWCSYVAVVWSAIRAAERDESSRPLPAMRGQP